VAKEKRQLDDIREAREQWRRDVYEPSVARQPERKDEFLSTSGYPFEQLYTPEQVENVDYGADLGFPGEYPYTRGVQSTMYRGRLWTMRQYAGFGTAEESNERYRYLLSQGTTGLSVAFDLPTQMGYDSDHPMAKGEVGRTGVAIDSIEDMAVMFNGIPLEKVSTSMTINATAAILLCLYIAEAENQGVPASRISGTVQNDILKEYIARGTYIFPPRHSMRIVTDVFAYASEHVPRWNTISISGYHIREAGSTAVQEVAFTLANGIAYVQAALDAGLDIDRFASRLAFFFNVHNNFIEEVAKFRAARRMWARIMRERFHAKKDQSLLLRFHTQTAGATLTAQQPNNNVVRVALQALAAVLGGTQSLHTNSRDEALALPTTESATLALRTQQIIAYESGAADVIDPLAGSYAVEALTNRIEEEATGYIEKIDALGGAVAAIEQGFQQREIQEAAYRYQRAIEKDEQIIVGVNAYRDVKEPPFELHKIDPAIEEQQKQRVRELRKTRDAARAREALSALAQAASGRENLIPRILEAVRAHCTLGEISDEMRGVFGLYKETVTL
jgi:methylmalonyl-CoA mutase N-terminal domain/subunit